MSIIEKINKAMKDKDEAGVSRGINGITKAMEGKLKKRRMTQYEFNACDSRLIPLHDGTASWKKHFSQADMVIEAVFEDLAKSTTVNKTGSFITFAGGSAGGLGVFINYDYVGNYTYVGKHFK